MNNILIKENLSFFQRVIRYIKELFLSIQNLPYEHKINKNVPTVKDIDSTIDLLLEGNSIARFGDGEFRIMRGLDIPFQKYNPKLEQKLKQILKNIPKNLLIGMPETFSSLSQFTFQERIFWRKYMARNRKLFINKSSLTNNIAPLSLVDRI